MTVVFAYANKIKCRAGAAVSRGTTKCVQISFISTVCRFAVGWGMPHPYKHLSRIVCRAGTCPRRCRNYRLCTISFVTTVRRLRGRHAQWSAQPLATQEPYGCGVPLAGACPTSRLS